MKMKTEMKKQQLPLIKCIGMIVSGIIFNVFYL